MRKAMYVSIGAVLLAVALWLGFANATPPIERPEAGADSPSEPAAALAEAEPADASARAAYAETLRALQQAERARVEGVDEQSGEPTEEPAGEEPSSEPTADEYTPEMPRPGTRTSSEAAPSQEEQQAFFDALFPQINPMIDECYGNLTEPRPDGTLNLVWSVMYEDGIGTLAEQIVLDEISEITNEDVLTCVRESIFSIELPTLAGYGRLQITSNHHFDGEGAEEREIEPER